MCDIYIIGGYPGEVEGTRTCFDCPNLRKGVYQVLVKVHAVSEKRAAETVRFALESWFPNSDSNAELIGVHACLREPQAPEKVPA